jgi:protein-disulfide isomerase
MIRRTRLLALASATTVAVALGGSAMAQSFTPQQRSDIEKIVKEYLLAHPEILQEVAGELEKRQVEAQSVKQKTAIEQHAATIFNSPRQVVLGNPRGDVTLVEFFDYNCGYCKKALVDMLELLKADKNLKVVLKEFPVLGEASVEAAQVAVAVRMQDASGTKYLDFHRKLLESRGRADAVKAKAAAKGAGLDMARIERDMQSPEIRASLEEVFKLAQELGLNGTPSYVVGSDVVIGAVGLAALKERVSNARCGKPAC